MDWIKGSLTGILSFFVVILTAVQGMKDFGLVSDLQLAVMVVSSIVVIVVPLVKAKWAGALKTGLDLVGAGIVILIPFVGLWVNGTPVTHEAVVLIIVAFIKALATELGVQVRTDWSGNKPSVTVVPPAPAPVAPAVVPPAAV